jgi:hypothetical protein
MSALKLISVILIGVSLSNVALAAEEKACLENNRIWGWQAVNERTLIVTDRTYQRYTVNLSGGCIGLDHYAGAKLVIRTKSSLGCLAEGDTIKFDSPGIGPLTCFVKIVRAGVPSEEPGPAAH